MKADGGQQPCANQLDAQDQLVDLGQHLRGECPEHPVRLNVAIGPHEQTDFV